MKKLAIILICLIVAGNLYSQELTWDVDFKSVFDNREGDNGMSDTKTFFFTNLAPEIGIKFTQTDRISGGIVWNQPIGCEWDGYRISPTLYYRHDGQRWNFSMGMFPRKQLTEELPGFLWCDSLAYHQNNIRGAMVQYRRDNGFFDAYIDWRGMQTEKQREAFNIVFHGQWSPMRNPVFIGIHAMMNHFALQKNAPADQHIVDNFLANPYIGIDLGKTATAMDCLMIRSGLLLTVERNRANSDGWKTPCGFWLEAVAEWRWLGIKNSLYIGGKLFPSYNEFRSDLYMGEPYYQSSFYNRTDIYANIYRNDYVNLKASLDFNFAKNNFIFYQRLILSVNIGSARNPFARRQ